MHFHCFNKGIKLAEVSTVLWWLRAWASAFWNVETCLVTVGRPWTFDACVSYNAAPTTTRACRLRQAVLSTTTPPRETRPFGNRCRLHSNTRSSLLLREYPLSCGTTPRCVVDRFGICDDPWDNRSNNNRIHTRARARARAHIYT